MATATLSLQFALLIILSLHVHQVPATHWTVTSYRVNTVEITQSPSTCSEGACSITITNHATIKPEITPSNVTPYATWTMVMEISNITVVYIYLPADSVPAEDLTSSVDYHPSTASVRRTDYLVPVTYTAPSNCLTPFTVTTYRTVDVPHQVTHLLEPFSATTITSDYDDPSLGRYTEAIIYIPSDAVPMTQAITEESIYWQYIADCTNPASLTTSSRHRTYPTGSSDDDDNYGGGSIYYRSCSDLSCPRLRNIIIAVVAVVSGLFLLGFLESWMWFTRLMKGRNALRGGTISWVLISLLVLFVIRVVHERTPEDQAVFRQQWAGMSAGTRFRLWLRWGFRMAYPVELLGEEPSLRESQRLRPPVSRSTLSGQSPASSDRQGQHLSVNSPVPSQPMYNTNPTTLDINPPGFVPSPPQQLYPSAGR